jgi:hypothetical protein
MGVLDAMPKVHQNRREVEVKCDKSQETLVSVIKAKRQREDKSDFCFAVVRSEVEVLTGFVGFGRESGE